MTYLGTPACRFDVGAVRAKGIVEASRATNMLRLIIENTIALEIERRQDRKLAHGGYRIDEQEVDVSTMSSYTHQDICDDVQTYISGMMMLVQRQSHRPDLPYCDEARMLPMFKGPPIRPFHICTTCKSAVRLRQRAADRHPNPLADGHCSKGERLFRVEKTALVYGELNWTNVGCL